MIQQITPITLPLPLNITKVNSYCMKTEAGYFLIDTGFSNVRHQIELQLENLGCQPGNLKLILLTHGDFDHIGNAVYLRERFGAKIAMHKSDLGMLERGDMFWERKIDNRMMKGLMRLFFPFSAKNRGTPDILLEDGESLVQYGLDAVVYNLPGHSSGSVCFLTAAGDLFCGDLLTSSKGKPELNPMMYDKAAGNASYERLKSMAIRTVYPGHGASFRWEELIYTK